MQVTAAAVMKIGDSDRRSEADAPAKYDMKLSSHSS